MANIRDYYSVVEGLRQAIETTSELSPAEKALVFVCGYGHMSEGDIQISLGVEGDAAVARPLREKVGSITDRFLCDFLRSKGGSIAGEHGIGLQRAQVTGVSRRSPEMIRTMRLLKNSFDPKGILNPYKVLPADLD